MSPAEPLRPATVVSALVEIFLRLGVREAFGVSGGAMAALWDALSSSPLGVYHFRHETGAAFAAIEAGFASGRPTVLFTTTGPGLTNALTGIVAARDERARVIVVSAAYLRVIPRPLRDPGDLAAARCRRRSTTAGRPFHFATVIDDPAQLAAIERELAAGLAAAADSSRTWRWTPRCSAHRRTRRTCCRRWIRCPRSTPPPAQVAACIDALQRRPVRDLGRATAHAMPPPKSRRSRAACGRR